MSLSSVTFGKALLHEQLHRSVVMEGIGPGRGHSRSASHGGVMATLSPATSAVVVGRPSALKSSRGHKRAFSQGQIVTDNAGFIHGHNRVGSKTDFILPPGYREQFTSTHSKKGHSRQGSCTESIYTLRNSVPPSTWKNFFCWHKEKSENDEHRFRTVVPNHLIAIKTPKSVHPNSNRSDNKIRTTKYTLLSFLPKNLLEQFHRVANLYFIFIVLLNWFPSINAFGKEIAMIPVIFVLGVTGIKDLFEDRRRHASDKRINNSTCRVYSCVEERYKKVTWKEVRVGDFIHLSNNELIPADVLLLRSSDPLGLCYIDTCNLDGETNLKQRQVAHGFVEKQNGFEPRLFQSVVEVDAPTTKIYRFHGALSHPIGKRVPVGTDNLLLRECVLKNTDYVEGIVVYAGHETKAMLNNSGPRYKRSSLERQMNGDVVWCVVMLVVFCLLGAWCSRCWLASFTIPLTRIPFIPYSESANLEAFLTFFTFIIILQVMIPLSLYVTIEMTKLLQVYHIHNNVDLFDPMTNKRIECRALNITEQLGQIQYIFSDKTGTLTENKMIFRRCTVGGIDYSHLAPERLQNRKVLPNPRLMDVVYAKSSPPASEATLAQCDRAREFLLVFAICNTVVVASHPHHDNMNASGIIECDSTQGQDRLLVDSRLSVIEETTPPAIGINQQLTADDYNRLAESRLITPSLTVFNSYSVDTLLGMRSRERIELSRSAEPRHQYDEVPKRPWSAATRRPPNSLSPISSSAESSPNLTHKNQSAPLRPTLLNVPSIIYNNVITKKSHVPKQKKDHAFGASPLDEADKPIYEAESPDELALVEMAYTYNCRLIKRTPTLATVTHPGEDVLTEYEVLKILPFDSSRKCMSVVVRLPTTNQIVLYCKGADSTILSALASIDDLQGEQVRLRTQHQLSLYAGLGLRVLVMGRRDLSQADWADWLHRHNEIELRHDKRESHIRESYSTLETNLTLIGATGIEDRLQEGVPETISALRTAGIVIWVLTGDKLETAINVAYSAKLFSPQMEILKLSAMQSKYAAEATILTYLNRIHSTVHNHENTGNADHTITSTRRKPIKKKALVVDGKTLTFILDRRSNLQQPFLELTRHCSAVLCCRATPLQKAYIVRVVKETLHMRTLAIGDGANDVSMIQAADVGVGISGQEGLQAVMAADFALSRFKYLERFLLVHGHWCYDRLASMVLYSFYKNSTFVFLIFWYQLYCGFSGTVMMDQMYLMLYNLLFTSLPPIIMGVYEQDAPEEVLLARPALYKKGRLGLVYQPYSFWLTTADSFYQSIAIFFVASEAYADSDFGIWEFGTVILTSCMFSMLLQAGLETKAWTIIHVASLVVSAGSFFLFSLLYNVICMQCIGLTSNTWVLRTTLGCPFYWFTVLLSTVVAVVPRFLFRAIYSCFLPDDITRALIETKQANKRGDNLLVSWSRSTSASSIYRAMEYSSKEVQQSTLTEVG